MKKIILLSLLGFVISSFEDPGDGCDLYGKHDCSENKRVAVFLNPLPGVNKKANGKVIVEAVPSEDEKSTSVTFDYKIKGVSPGKYNLVVHEYGDLTSIAKHSYGPPYKCIPDGVIFTMEVLNGANSVHSQFVKKMGKLVRGLCKARGRTFIIVDKSGKSIMLGVMGIANPKTSI